MSGPTSEENLKLIKDAILRGCWKAIGERDADAEAAFMAEEVVHALNAARSEASTPCEGGGSGAKEPDEITEDALLNRARDLVLSRGWKPGDRLSAHSTIQLLKEFGMQLSRSPESARCAHPECGCEPDAVCAAALSSPPAPDGEDAPATEGGEHRTLWPSGQDAMRAAFMAARPTETPGGGEPFEITDDLVRYIRRYGGRCRDCADEDGICPNLKLPGDVDQANAAIRHVLEALNYGLKHGFVAATPSPVQPDAVSGEAGRCEVGAGDPLFGLWERIGADSRLRLARRKLSAHEITVLVGHARATARPSEEVEALKAALSRLEYAARGMLIGISVHNALSADAPARRRDIKGPVVDALSDAAHAARAALNPPSALSEGRGARP